MDAPAPTRGWVFWFIAALVGFAVWAASPSAQADEPEVPAYIPPEALATEPALPELPACAEAPAPYEGEDPAVGELRAMRLDLRSMCVALVTRQEQLLTRSWWTTTQLLDDGDRLRSRVIDLLPPLEDIHGDLGGDLHVIVKGPDPLPVEDAASLVYMDEMKTGCGGPCDVKVVNDELPVSDAVAQDRLMYAGEAVDASGESNKYLLSLIIGVALGLPFVIGIWWLFHRAS